MVGALAAAALLAGAVACSAPGSPPGEETRSPSPAGGSESGPAPAEAPPVPAPVVERLAVRVVATHPHDPDAFTQGLLWHAGAVYESTGLYGASTLRRVDLASGAVRERVTLPVGLFGEGLDRVGERLVQLTWREGRARVYDLSTLALLEELPYDGEGWGLCWDGRRLVMSNGSSRLTFRDPATFARVDAVEVTLEGRPLAELNELECRPEGIYANVLGRDEIVRIDPASGRVTAVIDAAGLLTPGERAAAEALNGIAYREDAGTFLLTGKLWPKLFELELVPEG